MGYWGLGLVPCLVFCVFNFFLFLSHMYTFELTITQTSSSLVLYNDHTIMAERTWLEGRDMGKQLFVAIEQLLAEASISPCSVMDFRTVSALPDSSTSRRIAETVARVYTFGVETRGLS